MQASTVRPRRLISPVGLLFIAGLFVLAFVLLKTGVVSSLHEPLATSQDLDKDGIPASDELPDVLEVAFLKAQRNTGNVSDAYLGQLIADLLREGRVEESRQLLMDFPDLQLDESQRLLIDLELAALESTVALDVLVSGIAESPLQYWPAVLERSVSLSKQLSQPDLTFRLYEMHAAHGQVDPLPVLKDCGRYMSSVAEQGLAVECYRQARSSTDEAESQIDLSMAMLPLLPSQSEASAQIVSELFERSSLSIEHLTRLAPLLLEVERPEVAYRIYARLALRQPERSEHWLELAARWAEAANRSIDAAVFLDALVARVEEPRKLALLQKVESLLVGAGRGSEAYQRMKQRLDQGTPGSEALEKGIELARQLGESKQALVWNSMLLAHDPQDLQAMSLQVELALANFDLPLAIEVAEQLTSLQPHNSDVRIRLAEITEWNGDLIRSAEHWQWLSRKQNQPDNEKRLHALSQVVRISADLYDTASAALALRELTLLSRPDDQQIKDLARLYSLDGKPRQASTALKDISVLHGPSAMAIRTLAEHEYDYSNYTESLAAWTEYEKHFGRTTDSLLNRIELLWRLDRKSESAAVADELKGRSLLSQVSDYQLRLLGEIGWQFNMSWLTDLLRPRVAALEDEDARLLFGQRVLDDLKSSGRDRAAIDESMKLWMSTGHQDFAITTMQLALKLGDKPLLERFSPEQSDTTELQNLPDYWLEVAAARLREADKEGARKAYQIALKLDPAFATAAAAIIWMDIGEADAATLQNSLQTYGSLAEESPELWQAMAVGYLQLGAAVTSLQWFDRFLDQIDTDYSMLLTYADALEYAGRASDALRVREYTLQQLRPLLLDGTEKEQELILQQYVQLASRYAGSAHNETLINYVMSQPGEAEDLSHDEALWREDVAISWLMATQRLEQARVVMANLHSKRLQAPIWQRLAFALEDSDQRALREIINMAGPLSIGNHILALRQLGNDSEAYALAQLALSSDKPGYRARYHDIQIASQQYGYLRQVLPSFMSGTVTMQQSDGLDITERGFHVRHTLANNALGIALQASQRIVNTDKYVVNRTDQLSDVALSLFFGNALRGGQITTGLLSADDGDATFGAARWFQRSADQRREYVMELAYNERAAQSAELTVAGLQHRASASVDAGFGGLSFVRLQADASRLHSRINKIHLADGLGSQVEVGLRGIAGAHSWSASVQAGQINYERADELPLELQLADDSSLDSVLSEETRYVSVGAAFARGAVNSDFPTVNSPRYYLSARMGRYWPGNVFGVQ
ncbi:MAG: tetratricopeptide repeat protein, partial [Granulosicoccus sp.]